MSDSTREVAIPRLMDEHGGRLYRMATRICRTPQEAEDLVQETFLQAFRKWDQFEGRSSPITWLYTIASRQCQRFHRKRSGEPSQLESLEELLPSSEVGIPVLDVDESNLRLQAEERVGQGIAALPLEYRMPLILKDIAELSVAEVGEVLGLKPTTVKTRVHRARLKLRKVLIEGLPQRDAPPPPSDRQFCLDLLRAKQEALDRGVPLEFGGRTLCDRCAETFRALDITQDACRALGSGRLPDEIRRFLEENLES